MKACYSISPLPAPLDNAGTQDAVGPLHHPHHLSQRSTRAGLLCYSAYSVSSFLKSSKEPEVIETCLPPRSQKHVGTKITKLIIPTCKWLSLVLLFSSYKLSSRLGHMHFEILWFPSNSSYHSTCRHSVPFSFLF